MIGEVSQRSTGWARREDAAGSGNAIRLGAELADGETMNTAEPEAEGSQVAGMPVSRGAVCKEEEEGILSFSHPATTWEEKGGRTEKLECPAVQHQRRHPGSSSTLTCLLRLPAKGCCWTSGVGEGSGT